MPKIQVIAGGLAMGDTHRARKAYLRSPYHEVMSFGHRPKKIPKQERKVISFSNDELLSICHPHMDALVVTFLISNHKVDQILYLSTLQQMRVELKSLKPIRTSLVGFNDGSISLKGSIMLPTNFGEGQLSITLMIKYLIIAATLHITTSSDDSLYSL